MDAQERTVSAELAFHVDAEATIMVQLAPARSAGTVRTEVLRVSDGDGAVPWTELEGEHGGRLHQLRACPGPLVVSYRAELAAPAGADPGWLVGGELDRLVHLRPSRYCPSDHLVGWAVAEFGHLATARGRVEALTGWIYRRIAYRSGASSVHDSAEDTLLTGAGVCRDFAHLGVGLCRALGVPARFVSVYAPGLEPMDFHAVFEACYEGHWWAHDATRMAPRSSLVRIATGRDAADTPFATVVSGVATLLEVGVTATSRGPLPRDTHASGALLD